MLLLRSICGSSRGLLLEEQFVCQWAPFRCMQALRRLLCRLFTTPARPGQVSMFPGSNVWIQTARLSWCGDSAEQNQSPHGFSKWGQQGQVSGPDHG